MFWMAGPWCTEYRCSEVQPTVYICRQYTNYAIRRHGHAIIVFDEYQGELSTKYGAHERHTGGRAGPTVDFTLDMVMKSKKEDLLSKKDKKHRFIGMLGQSLEHGGCEIRHAKGESDVLIVETTVQSAMSCETTLVGDDMDMLVLLCFQVFFKPEIRSGTKKSPRCWNITYVQRVLGRAVWNNMLFAHAILICDTTSRVFSIGIGLAIKHIRSDNHFITRAELFLQENATLADISSAGEASLVCLYTRAVGDTLDILRLQRFHQKVATSTRFMQPKHLPPTSSAAKYPACVFFFRGTHKVRDELQPGLRFWVVLTLTKTITPNIFTTLTQTLP